MTTVDIDVDSLIRPAVAAMESYTPILPFDVLSAQLNRPPEALIKLDANENPYGPSPKVLKALQRINDTIPIYPDPEARALRAALAGYTGISADHLLVGAGADELIDLLLRLFCDPGDVVINCPPTFGMYSFDASLNGARTVNVPRRQDFSLNVEAIEKAASDSNAKLLFLCSPNNPDGSLIPLDVLDRLLALPLIVVLDQAYIEFAGTASVITRVPRTPNLVVLRTFSKWAGLAGLRVGYGAFPLPIITHLWKIKQPYNLNVAADAAARVSLADLPALEANVKRIITERDRLFRELAAISYLQPYPSRSNFVLCRVTGIEATSVKQRLAEEFGILIRYFDKPGLRDHIRITAGTSAQTDALIAALKRLSPSL
jgi:histidinol-phosphate aminotransferase